MSGNVSLKTSFIPFCLLICLVIAGITTAGCLSMLPAASAKSAGPAIEPAAASSGAVDAVPAPTVSTATPGGNCGAGKTMCDGFCRDTALDIANCGGCGLACPANAACRNSQCFCKDGFQSSAGQCLPVTTDPAVTTTTPKGNGCTDGLSPCPDGFCYCGTCGTRCLQTQRCENDVCVPPVEQPAGQSAAASGVCGDGAQHDLQTEVANCGSCGNACSGGKTCSAGTCTCPSGQTDCSGVCKDLTSDTRNCGGCGVPCNLGEGCSSGKCILTCARGASICDGSCTYLSTDTQHCGSCTTKCPTGATCSNSVCACPAGQSDCGGVCTNVMSNSLNCGSCGHQCINSMQCLSGTCSCPAGLSNCRGACVDLSTSSANCGVCGKPCDSGFTCTGGTCKSSIGLVITPRRIPL